MKELWSIFILAALLHGIRGQVTPPQATTEARGDDVSLVCTSTENNPIFTWSYTSIDVPTQTLYLGDARGTNLPRYANIWLQEGTAAQTSILNISAIELEDEGEYLCTTTTATTENPPTTEVTVEAPSISSEIDLINTENFATYQATYDAIGSKPEETLTWVLNGVMQTAGIVETDPDTSADPLFDKRSVFTFPASLDNYDVTLVCEIGGHQVSSLDRPVSRRVNVQNPPQSGDIAIKFTSDGTSLTVLCDTEGAAAIPPMDTFSIYSNGTLVTGPSSDNSVTDTEPEQDTEFTCAGSNYLGSTNTTKTFVPGRPTIPPTTAQGTAIPPVVGPTSGGRTGGDGANVAAIAGGVVGAIVVIVIIVIAVCYCKKEERFCFEAGGTKSSGSSKPAGSAVGSSNGSEREKTKPEAAPRGHGSIQHTNDNPNQDMYAMVDKKPSGGRGGDAPDRGSGPGQNEPQGMLYADLDLSHKAGHTDKHVPKNENDVVVYSSILV